MKIFPEYKEQVAGKLPKQSTEMQERIKLSTCEPFAFIQKMVLLQTVELVFTVD